MAAGSSAGTAGPARRADTRSPLLRVAVTGSALAGAVALIIVTGPIRPEVYVGTGVAVLAAAVAYLVWPRWGTIVLLTLGTLICLACAIAYTRIGAVPWLLTSFWAGAATLLAGLLDLIGRDGRESMVGVTVAAVLSLLLLSALGLGQYVRVNWPLTGRAMLESIPQDLTGQAGGTTSVGSIPIEQASGGRWVERLVYRTRNRVRTWDAFALAVQSDGWRVITNRTCRRLRAVKDGYVLDVVVPEPYQTSAEATGVPAETQDLVLMASVSALGR